MVHFRGIDEAQTCLLKKAVLVALTENRQNINKQICLQIGG